MEIVFAASEMAPFAKTGGLADIIGTLPREIARLGHRVSIFIPKYKKVTDEGFHLESVLNAVHIPLGSEVETARIFSCRYEEVTVFFAAHPEYFDREELYGTPMGDYPDNDRRFIFFQRAVIEALKRLNLKPDVLHCHDWQTGLIPAYLKTLYQGDPFFKRTKTFFTIHNPAHQGNFPPDSVSVTGLSWEEFRYDRLEFYGKISFLKGGLVYSDVLTTVSERYAQEIQTREFGCGMEGAFLRRREDLFGILNGIDLNEWNPEKDPDIEANYGAKNLIGKQVCKEALQRENHLKADPDIPLFGFVSRLAAQKGLDLMTSVIEEIAKRKWQLVILGTGDEQYHKVLRILAKRHPEYLGLNVTFDLKMAKRIFAGSDLFLMPSRFEPCGLGQMISLRFGTVPVVRETGGLRDTIQEFDPNTGKGNGFTFAKYDADDFFAAMERAVQMYRDRKEWARLIRNGMGSDFSWKVSARRYVELYERSERKTLNV